MGFTPEQVAAARQREAERAHVLAAQIARSIAAALLLEPNVIHTNIARDDETGVYVELVDGSDFDVTVRAAE
jgi:hypothetical protein